MKILHVSHSDASGGAAVAAQRLHRAQRAAGLESRMMVIYRNGDDPTIDAPLGRMGRLRTRAGRFVAKRVAAGLSRGHPGMRSLGLMPTGLGAAINQSDADLVHLHWVGGEALSLSEIGAIRRPLVWTLHDQWALRGADHYGEGEAWNAEGIDGWTWRRKQRLWKALSVSVVCPSHWLAAEAARCAPFHVKRVEVIPYALDAAVFQPHDRSELRSGLGLPENARVLLFGAENPTAEPRKGFDLLKRSLRLLRHNPQAPEFVLAVFGASEGGQIEGFPTFWLGRLSGDPNLARAYAAADAFVAPSRADNLPNVVLEALFCGVPCVAFDVGGFPDMIEPGKTGYLAEPFEPEALAKAITLALAMPASHRVEIRHQALARFNPAEVVERHAALYRWIFSEAEAKTEG